MNDPEVTLRLMLSGAEQIAERLRVLVSTIRPSSRRAHFYSRVRAKSLDSIREKVIRNKRGHNLKQQRLPNYSFRSLNDAVGFRFVTLYEAELPDAIDDIIGVIIAGQTLHDQLFSSGSVWDCMKEATFIVRPEADPYRDLLEHLRQRIITDCGGEQPAAKHLAKCDSEIRRERLIPLSQVPQYVV